MNNATQESASFHLMSAPGDRRPEPDIPETRSIGGVPEEFPEITSELDKIRLNPREATIRAILRYASRKDEPVL